jgi:hypothetical protein
MASDPEILIGLDGQHDARVDLPVPGAVLADAAVGRRLEGRIEHEFDVRCRRLRRIALDEQVARDVELLGADEEWRPPQRSGGVADRELKAEVLGEDLAVFW